jgi:hypothetical protein
MKNRIDADKKKYDEKCEKNRDIIQSYWNKQKDIQTNTNEYQTNTNDIQTITNSNSNSNSNSKIIKNNNKNILSKDNTKSKDFEKKEITIKIDFLISELKNTCDNNSIAYQKEDERNFARHILTAKEF